MLTRNAVLSALSIILLAIFIIKFRTKDKMYTIKIAYYYNESAVGLDPANIQTINQANLIENLYSRLLDYNNQGQLECVLCNKFWTEDNFIFFDIKKGIKTKNGYELTSIDVVKSLSRLFVLNSNTHGNLTNFIHSHDDIGADKNIVKIKLIKPHYSQFVLPLLASMDYSIVPSISINSKNEIFDHENTFGPYYVSKDSNEGKLELSPNLHHPFYSVEMPSLIHIAPSDPREFVDSFLKGEVDVIDITNYPRTVNYEKLFNQKEKKFTSTSTTPINTFFLGIKSETVKNFTKEQIFYALSIVKDKYLAFRTYGFGFKENVEFIPEMGNGHLNQTQKSQIVSLRNIKEKPKFNKPIVLGVLESSYDKVKDSFKEVPEILVKSYKEDPGFLPEDQRPDITIQTTDSSFNEDVSMLSYNFSMENMGKNKRDGDIWIKNYIDIESKEERIKILQNLFFEMLSTPSIYPVGASPYWAIASDDLELNFPKLFPGSHWWKIRKK